MENKKKRNFFEIGHIVIGKYKNWFIFFTFMIVAANPLILAFNAIFKSKNNIVLPITSSYQSLHVKSPGNNYHINSISISFNDSLTNKSIELDLSDCIFTISADIDSALSAWSEKTKCNNIETPAIISTEYILNGTLYENQSEYILRRVNNSKNIYYMTFSKRRDNQTRHKTTLDYLYRCGE